MKHLIKILKIINGRLSNVIKLLMPDGNKKVTHT